MLTYEDCVDLSGLSTEEVDAIASHEHLPRMIALELGSYLLKDEEGVPVIKKMILDDIKDAKATKNHDRSALLEHVLLHFVETHPSNPKNK